MTTEEFSNNFDTLAASYRRFKDFDNKENLDSIEFDEYEKSYFLTKAQEEIVKQLYTGKNQFGDSFEKTEELRRYLNDLVVTSKQSLTESNIDDELGLTDKSYVIPLLDNVMFIIYEAVKLNDDSLGCYSGTIINVQPITHDEYNKIKDNPFRGATRYRALRLDIVNEEGKRCTEIISKYGCSQYILRYLKKLKPIILIDLPNELTIEGESDKTECELDSELHNFILERAVGLALASKGLGNTQQNV